MYVGLISYEERQAKQENSGGQNSAVRLKIWIREEINFVSINKPKKEKWK